MAAPVILFQAPNGVGLGHMNRLAAMALEIERERTDARLVFVVEGQSHDLLESLGLPWLSLPHSHTLYHSTHWDAWTAEERNALMRTIADSVVSALRPDVIVFDCFPCFPVVNAAATRGIPIVLCVRLMRDMASYFESVEPHVPLIDRFIFPHTAREMDLPDALRDKAAFVGQIVRNQMAAGSTGQTSESGSGAHVVICGGAGGQEGTVDFYNLALRAIARARARYGPMTPTLVAGPLFKDWTRLELVDGTRVVPFDPELVSTLNAADLVMCQAGYNTIAEVSQLSTPTICVPGVRAFDDQEARAAQVAATSPHVCVAPLGEDAELATLICTQLSREHRPRSARVIGAPGAADAARVILEVATRDVMAVF